MSKTTSTRKPMTSAIVTGSPSAKPMGITQPAAAKGGNTTKPRK